MAAPLRSRFSWPLSSAIRVGQGSVQPAVPPVTCTSASAIQAAAVEPVSSRARATGHTTTGSRRSRTRDRFRPTRRQTRSRPATAGRISRRYAAALARHRRVVPGDRPGRQRDCQVRRHGDQTVGDLERASAQVGRRHECHLKPGHELAETLPGRRLPVGSLLVDRRDQVLGNGDYPLAIGKDVRAEDQRVHATRQVDVESMINARTAEIAMPLDRPLDRLRQYSDARPAPYPGSAEPATVPTRAANRGRCRTGNPRVRRRAGRWLGRIDLEPPSRSQMRSSSSRKRPAGTTARRTSRC